MQNRIKAGYALGHMTCDITSGLYGTYLMIYMSQVIKLDAIRCGIVLTVNSFLDSLAVLVVGFITDRFRPFNGAIESDKFWHLVGCITVPILLPLHFIPPPGHDPTHTDQNDTLAYYLVVAGLIPFAFALVQIPHLKVVGKLTERDTDNVLLQSIKNAMSELAFMIIHVMAIFLFIFDNENDDNGTNNALTRTGAGV